MYALNNVGFNLPYFSAGDHKAAMKTPTCMRFRYLLHMCIKSLINAHVDISNEARGINHGLILYHIPINDTELSDFWSSDTESRINELGFSDSISLSFKMRLTSVTCFEK